MDVRDSHREASRALAKCLAYLKCGKRDEAAKWARALNERLIELGATNEQTTSNTTTEAGK